MRAIWSGSISFGLVNIPVKLYSAAEDRSISFDMLHKKDMSPIRYARICKEEEKEVPYEDIIKGYEYYDGSYIPIDEKDFERAYAKKVKTIEVTNFSNEKEIDPIFFEKPYYLEPDKGADKPFSLFREALAESKKVAIAKFVLRNKEHLSIIKPEADFLLLEQLRFVEEIRKTDELKKPQIEQKISKEELKLALALIDQQTAQFVPENFHNTFVDEMREIIKEKSEGKVTISKEEIPAPTPAIDLMEILKKSLEQERIKTK